MQRVQIPKDTVDRLEQRWKNLFEREEARSKRGLLAVLDASLVIASTGEVKR